MKTKFRTVLIAAFLVIAPLLMVAQSPPHPNNGSAPIHGTNGPVGDGAPIGSGLILLIAMGTAFGARKLYQMRDTESILE